MLARYLRTIEVQRGDYNGRMLTIRRQDLTAIACIFGCPPGCVARPARQPGPPPCPLTRRRTLRPATGGPSRAAPSANPTGRDRLAKGPSASRPRSANATSGEATRCSRCRQTTCLVDREAFVLSWWWSFGVGFGDRGPGGFVLHEGGPVGVSGDQSLEGEVRLCPKINHIALANRPEVYDEITNWWN
ncbi:MAG TPA: hypothetical protein VE466_13665 [Acidimicrobiales bacterium]|nr:hypothetical protein [Acidimicrobiales bacterium]